MPARLAHTLNNNLLTRPALFVTAGIALGTAALALDRHTPTSQWLSPLTFTGQAAQPLLAGLAAAMLTLAGLTFWVRAASVNLAASQYSPRVVHEFLEDWFQQSMMALMLAGFAYILTVYRTIAPTDSTAPPAATAGALVFAGGAVIAVLGAIRNGVRSMSPDALAQHISEATLAKIARVGRRSTDPHAWAGARNIRKVSEPDSEPTRVRAAQHGWVQHIDAARLREATPAGATVRIDVRIGVFVPQGRALATVWSDAPLDGDAVRAAVKLGRRRLLDDDIEYGLQQLVDIAVGVLHSSGDEIVADEIIAQLEVVMRNLAITEQPPLAYEDDQGRLVLRAKEFTFADYAAVAYDRLRRAAAAHPAVAVSLLRSLGGQHRELRGTGDPARLGPLERHANLVVAEIAAYGHLDADVERVRRIAGRVGFPPPA